MNRKKRPAQGIAAGCRNKKKVIRIGLLVIFVLVIVAAGVNSIHILGWRDRIDTVIQSKLLAASDRQHKDGSVYAIRYCGDYALDRFLALGGASTALELKQFLMENVSKGAQVSKVSAAGCSSFTCASEDGSRLFCRNFDLSKGSFAMVYTEPGNGRYASLSTTNLRYLGISSSKDELTLSDKVSCLSVPYIVQDGMNEAGLACSVYICYQGVKNGKAGIPELTTTKTDIDTEKPDVTNVTLLRLILDYTASVDEAVELIQQYDYHDANTYPFHYSVSDASGKAVCIEWVSGTNRTDLDGKNRALHVTYSDGTDPLVITNFALAENYYAEDDYKLGYDRYVDVKKALDDTGNIVDDVQEAMDILQIAGGRTRIESGKSDVRNSMITLWSVVYNLTERTVTLCANEHYDDPAYTFTYSFADFFEGL